MQLIWARGRPARVPVGRRVAPLVLAAGLAGGLCAGCASYQHTLVPTFQPQDTGNVALHRKVLEACAHLPGVVAEPLGKVAAYDVTFNVSHANTLEISHLYLCLSHQPSVLAVQDNASDDGE